MSETSKKIIERIHERNITHIPKWYFLIKNISVWAAFFAAVLLGAFSISIEEAVLEGGAGAHSIVSTGSSLLIFHDISFLWILSTVLFVVLAFLNLRLTREGYRYRAAWIMLGLLLFVFTFGLLFHHEGIDDRTESIIEHSSFYQSIFPD